MKVKVSSVMLRELKKAIPAYRWSIEKLTRDQYAARVDYDLYRNENDFSINAGKFSVIRIEYPPECYAMTRYLTTYELTRIFRASDKTFCGFIDAVKSAIEI